MTQDGSPGLGAAARFAILASAAALAYVAVRSAVQNEFGTGAPALATALYPADGISLTSAARARIGAAGGDIDDDARTLYKQAIAREPLIAEPLTLAALDKAATGDQRDAERLMIEARGRDPRTTAARFWLFDHFLRTGRFDQALDEVGPAIRLKSDASTAVVNVLTALTYTDEGRAALVRKLSQGPFWRTFFFQSAAQQADPQAMLSILRQLPRAASADGANEERRAVYLSLIGSGNGRAAYSNWQQSLPSSYRNRAKGIYDGNFAGFPGAQPFNWIIPDESALGEARMIGAGDLPQSNALDVRYFGSTGGTLAEQYTYAAPGSYRLQLATRRRSTGATGGRLTVQLRCVGGDMLAEVPLDDIDQQLRGFSATAQVPATCPIVVVRIVGSPGDVFSEVQAQITGLALIPTG